MPIPKAPQAFPKSEYLRRLALVKAEMAKRGVDVLVVSSSSNITYLTGNTTRLYSTYALIVMVEREVPTLLVRAMDVAGCIHTTWLEREHIVPYGDDFVGRPDQNGYDVFIDFLQSAGWGNRSIGIEANITLPLAIGVVTEANVAKFKAKLPNVVDCSRLVDGVRIIKSDLEIEVMRDAAAIADAVVLRAAEVIRAGVHESEVAAELAAVQIRGPRGGKPATGMFPSLFTSSPRTGTSHIVWSDDVLRQGSQVNLETSGNRHQYYVPLMRTYVIGKPSDRLQRMHEGEVAGLEAALDAVRPGNTASDVASAFYRTMEKHGLSKASRCGYAIGIDWPEPISLQLSDKTVLKPNMTFHLMLGNWVDEDFGYSISESFRVTDSGVEVLTKAPRILFEL